MVLGGKQVKHWFSKVPEQVKQAILHDLQVLPSKNYLSGHVVHEDDYKVAGGVHVMH